MLEARESPLRQRMVTWSRYVALDGTAPGREPRCRVATRAAVVVCVGLGLVGMWAGVAKFQWPARAPRHSATGVTIEQTATVCASSGENCKHSRCCQEPGTLCYEKTKGYATCRARCDPGPASWEQDGVNWTCRELGERAVLKNPHQPAGKFWWPPNTWPREQCGDIEEGIDYMYLAVIDTVYNVGSQDMCCAACEAYPECGAWTYGKEKDVPGFTNRCWLKKIDAKEEPKRKPNKGLVSGRPSRGPMAPLKWGVLLPEPSHNERLDEVHPKKVREPEATKAWTERFADNDNASGWFGKCPGAIRVEGHGQVSMISTGAGDPTAIAGRVEVAAGSLIRPHLGGRAYFADGCEEGEYDQKSYTSLRLLGKRLRWKTDVSGAGCGCNAAFYLASMPQNSEIGTCDDYYCDANRVCGVDCAEIDLQEANLYSFMSTLHRAGDGQGVSCGYGGSTDIPSHRDWTGVQYGPESACINTTRPYDVAVSFPTTERGALAAMEVELSQVPWGGGEPCTVSGRIDRYDSWKPDDHPMDEISKALDAGMTPVVSFWNSDGMLWMDGIGVDGLGPCVRDWAAYCPEAVRFWDFAVESLG